MKNFGKKIDRFAISPKLYIKKGESFPTIYGGMMTLAVLGLVIAAGINFSQSLLYKKNPNIVTSQHNFEEIPKFSLAEFNMGFFVNTYFNGKILDPTIFEISAGIIRTVFSDDGNKDIEFTPIKMEPCSLDSFKSKSEYPVLKRVRYDLNMCFSEEVVKNMSIEGGWGQKIMDQIYIDFNICVNSTENGYHCKPKEYIDKVISSSYLGVDIVDSLIDLDDFETPIKSQIYTSYTMCSTKIYRDI